MLIYVTSTIMLFSIVPILSLEAFLLNLIECNLQKIFKNSEV